MSDLYLVTVEGKEDGVWWDEPEGYDTEHEARQHAAKKSPPDGYCIGIYSCRLIGIAGET